MYRVSVLQTRYPENEPMKDVSSIIEKALEMYFEIINAVKRYIR